MDPGRIVSAQPIDTGIEVVVGYLVTHPDGYEARLGPDETLAQLYAARNRGRIEPMFVRRSAPADSSPTADQASVQTSDNSQARTPLRPRVNES